MTPEVFTLSDLGLDLGMVHSNDLLSSQSLFFKALLQVTYEHQAAMAEGAFQERRTYTETTGSCKAFEGKTHQIRLAARHLHLHP